MRSLNLVTLTLGLRSGKIKWDATWNLVAWLLNPRESHELAHAVLAGLTIHVFGQALEDCEVYPELPIGFDEQGKSKWPDLTLFFPTRESPTQIIVMDDVDVRSPGGSRKLANLRTYGRLAKENFPDASVRIVAITNATLPGEITRVTAVMAKTLGESSSETPDAVSWYLVPLRAIGEWAKSARPTELPDNKFSAFVSDVIEWTGALDENEPDSNIEAVGKA